MFYNILAIGSGPAGSTAAIYAARDGFKVGVLEGNVPGGLLTTTTKVDNFPGFSKGIDGFDLVVEMKNQAIKHGAEYLQSSVVKIEKTIKFELTLDNNSKISADSIIIASGSYPKMLGIETENKYIGKGVHICATCDGAFYKGKTLVVVGGGDSAMEESLFLSNLAKSVIILNRSEKPRATQIMQNKVASKSNIQLVNNAELVEYVGKEKLDRIKYKTANTEKIEEMAVDAVFLAIGHLPNTKFLNGFVELTENGYIKTQNNVFTNVEGVFAAGDVVDSKYRQAITAAGFGCIAAIEARKYLHK
jgi:thioredoxin reductase (NADPH)